LHDIISALDLKGDFEKENELVSFFKNQIMGDISYTHSSMIGPSDHRIPKTGKLNVVNSDSLTKLYYAISFFYDQGRPLTLVEMATSRFRFYEDVDLFIPDSEKLNIGLLEKRWID